MKNKIFTILHYSFFALVMIGCVILTLIFNFNWLTLIACLSGIGYIVFLSDRNLLNFIIGFISSTTYIFVAFNANYERVLFTIVLNWFCKLEY